MLINDSSTKDPVENALTELFSNAVEKGGKVSITTTSTSIEITNDSILSEKDLIHMSIPFLSTKSTSCYSRIGTGFFSSYKSSKRVVVSGGDWVCIDEPVMDGNRVTDINKTFYKSHTPTPVTSIRVEYDPGVINISKIENHIKTFLAPLSDVTYNTTILSYDRVLLYETDNFELYTTNKPPYFSRDYTKPYTHPCILSGEMIPVDIIDNPLKPVRLSIGNYIINIKKCKYNLNYSKSKVIIADEMKEEFDSVVLLMCYIELSGMCLVDGIADELVPHMAIRYKPLFSIPQFDISCIHKQYTVNDNFFANYKLFGNETIIDKINNIIFKIKLNTFVDSFGITNFIRRKTSEFHLEEAINYQINKIRDIPTTLRFLVDNTHQILKRWFCIESENDPQSTNEDEGELSLPENNIFVVDQKFDICKRLMLQFCSLYLQYQYDLGIYRKSHYRASIEFKNSRFIALGGTSVALSIENHQITYFMSPHLIEHMVNIVDMIANSSDDVDMCVELDQNDNYVWNMYFRNTYWTSALSHELEHIRRGKEIFDMGGAGTHGLWVEPLFEGDNPGHGRPYNICCLDVFQMIENKGFWKDFREQALEIINSTEKYTRTIEFTGE